MRLRVRSLLPTRISGQIAVIIVASLLVFHAILTAGFFFLDHREPDGLHGQPVQLGPLVQLIAAAEPSARPRLVQDIGRVFPQLDIALAASVPAAASQPDEEPFLHGLRHSLGAGFRVDPLEPGARAVGPPRHRAAIHLPDGQVVTARMPAPHKPPFHPETMAYLSIAVSTTLLGLWAARALTAPLRAFARAAEGFSPDAEIAQLPEGGPDEIRAAAGALNRMRARIKHLIDDRTRMLAAVGHDLRTPITRLRLRSEFIEDAALRTHMLEDLAQMNAMVESLLMFLREGKSQEQAVMIDVATSLQTICDQFADMGRDVRYDGPDHVTIKAIPAALHRAVSNLIDNAVRYGVRALVRLTVQPGTVVIAVEDDGPGIPDGDKDAMLEPFVRGDAARGMDGQAGCGLGLSIARAVVAAHGGTLALLDRQPTGLITRIELPVNFSPARAAA